MLLFYSQQSDTVYINHTPGRDPCSEIVSQQKSDFMGFLWFIVAFVLSFCFLRERKYMKLGGWGGPERY